MIPFALTLQPGVDTMRSPLAVGQGLTDSNLIRYRAGQIQKLGGCTRLTSSTFTGSPLAMLAFDENNGTGHVAVGATTAASLLTGTTIRNISPTGFVSATEWSLDKWGQNLVACYPGSTLYQWVPPDGAGNILAAVSGAPSAMNGCFIAAPEQQLIAWGVYSASLSAQDPLLVGWCDVANLNQWTAAANNQAGTFRLSSGSRIVGGTWFGLSGLLWTDLDLWGMTYVNFPLVYGFNKISPNCGLISRHAQATLGTVIPWMSQNTFFIFDGNSVQELPCTVLDFVFNNLDRSYTSRIFAAANSYFDEVAWWFPTTGSSGQCNAYAKWNKAANRWDKGYGSLSLGAWCDQSSFGAPVGADYTGLIQQFETSNDFDGAALDDFIETGWITMAEGEQVVHLDRIWPDFVWSGSSPQLSITVVVADAPNGPTRTYGPYTVTPSTQWFVVDASGMVMRFKIEGNAPGTFWRYGKPLAAVAPDGRP